MTRREIERILGLPDTKTTLGLRDRCILELLYATGIRSLELRNLNLSDLDLQAKILRIRCGRGGRDRLVPLGRMAVRFLKKYLDEARARLVIGDRLSVIGDQKTEVRREKAESREQKADGRSYQLSMINDQ